MKLAAIYNSWDGIELLSGSIRCIKDHVDIIIVVWQKCSNWGEYYNPMPEIIAAFKDHPGVNKAFIEYIPKEWGGFPNEINKRNLGLEYARQEGCTHFLHMDVDEYYQFFEAAKVAYIRSGEAGSVCPIYTYINKPEYRCDRQDGYYVPFIHELHPDTVAGGSNYGWHVDPTRRINCKAIVKLSEPMHHFSYIRYNIERKVKNSSARNNIKNGTIMKSYHELSAISNAEGFYIPDWDRKITIVPNIFDIKV